MANSPHVVIVPSWWPSAERPLHGVFFPDFAGALAQAGMKIGVITPDLVGARYWRTTTAPWRPRIDWEAVDDVPLVRIRGKHTSLGRAGFHMHAYRRWLAMGLAAYVERFGRPDLLHALVSLPAGWACTHLDDPLSRRVVITEHTGPFSLLMAPAGSAEMTLEGLRRASQVVAVSSHLREAMQAAGVGRPIEVIGNLVGERFAASPPPPVQRDQTGRAIFQGVYVGRLTPEKGLAELSTAASLLSQEQAFVVKWHVVGTGPMEGELRAAMSKEGIAARFHGFQDAAGVARILQSAHFLILPSHGENFPLAICEALASGRPVVTTDVPGCAALVGPEDGEIAPARDTHGLIDAIRRCVSRYERWDWQAIGRRARERFSRERVAASYAAIYEKAAAGAPDRESRLNSEATS